MSWYGGFPEYVPVAERRAKARRQMDRLRKQGHTIEPVEIEGRTIARSFWGKSWCEHLESFSDFSNRLPRGRTYARNGSVCHLGIKPGLIEAKVAGSKLYTINIRITKLDTTTWEAIKRRCAGQIGSILELLQGRLSDQVMTVVADRQSGLFPKPGQIKLGCSCPDWATMCKHVAAVLYGVGNRLDTQPELLFTLRGVDPQELISTELDLPDHAADGAPTLADDRLGDVFGIEFDDAAAPAPSVADNAPAAASARKTQTKAKSRNGRGNGKSTSVKTQAARRAKTKVRAKAKVKAQANGKAKRHAQKNTRSGTSRRVAAGSSSRSAGQSAAERSKQNGKPTTIRPTGKSVARLRRRAGLTQCQFAEQLGVSTASVARWEAADGRLKLQPRSLEALAAVKDQLEARL